MSNIVDKIFVTLAILSAIIGIITTIGGTIWIIAEYYITDNSIPLGPAVIIGSIICGSYAILLLSVVICSIRQKS